MYTYLVRFPILVHILGTTVILKSTIKVNLKGGIILSLLGLPAKQYFYCIVRGFLTILTWTRPDH